MEYLVVIERGPSSFGVYVPDLPGCVAVGETRQEVEALIREAIEFHIEGLREEASLGCASDPCSGDSWTWLPNRPLQPTPLRGAVERRRWADERHG